MRGEKVGKLREVDETGKGKCREMRSEKVSGNKRK